jgi:hypothetical protein
MSPRKLVNLVIESVALVDAGANPLAKILLSKRAPGLTTPDLRASLAKHDDTMRRFNREVSDYYRQFPEDSMRDASPVEKIQKAYEHGGSFDKADAQAGLEQEADRLQRKHPELTDEQAITKAYESRVNRFREYGERNPTWLEVVRKAEQSPTPEQSAKIQKAVDDEASAWRRIELIADRLQAKDATLTKPAAVSKALLDPEGQRAYRDYTDAQRRAARARGVQ